MIVEIKVPSPGESITEVEIGTWLVEDGAVVSKDQEIAEVESDKATLTIVASEGGKIEIKAAEGDSVPVGDVVCTIDTSVAPAPVQETQQAETSEKVETVKEEKVEETPLKVEEGLEKVKISPVAKEIMKEHDLSVDDVISGLRRLGKKEVEAVVNMAQGAPATIPQKEASREVERNRMSSLRRKLSSRLVAVKNETAMLTTFNEIDMSYVMDLRKKSQQKFIDTHGLRWDLCPSLQKPLP